MQQDYKVKDVAALFNVTPQMIYKLIRLGKVDTYKVGNARRVRHESVDKLRNTYTPTRNKIGTPPPEHAA